MRIDTRTLVRVRERIEQASPAAMNGCAASKARVLRIMGWLGPLGRDCSTAWVLLDARPAAGPRLWSRRAGTVLDQRAA